MSLRKHTGTARSLGVVTPFTLRMLRRGGGTVAAFVIVLAGLLAGTGWLYVLRGLHWLSLGPRIPDALPLLQLAASDGQPLLWVLVAWLLAGALTGVALAGLRPVRRSAVALVIGLVVLLVADQAAYALARNVGFGATLFSRAPRPGPILEAFVFALGCWLPRAADRGPRPRTRRWSLISLISRLDERAMGSGERRHGGEHDRNRQPVHHAGDGVRA